MKVSKVDRPHSGWWLRPELHLGPACWHFQSPTKEFFVGWPETSVAEPADTSVSKSGVLALFASGPQTLTLERSVVQPIHP